MIEEFSIPGKSKQFHERWENLQKALGNYLESLNIDSSLIEMHAEYENVKDALDRVDILSRQIKLDIH